MSCCRILPVVHILVFAAFLTAWTIALLSPVPQKSAERVLGGAFWVLVFGKGLHVGAYAFLAILGGTLGGRQGRWVLLALVLHGGLTEFFQQFVGRTTALRDAGLDALGVMVGGLVVLGWRAVRSRGQERPAGQEQAGG
jgi:VanZ family protein